ncbi:MAG: V-type ATP synthase subunit A [Thiobacillaceae bacterium]|jgi:V/A-type H+-transporting ATPase subunit A|nr:V-type ATP synthase subunit A [Hydrogenophilales bacterium]MBP8902283.1 V-type ATP synthase subunit A [Thiobacillaceae bacterium]MBP9914888.1 V-type ATP synthase subunit A [Thiobacillaceae bacterium]
MGKILEINGPLVKLQLADAVLGEQVRVGKIGLVGEVIGRDGDTALAQLYEDTAGLRPGEVAEGLGWPLSVELGPGLLNAIFDGVQRPLNAVWEQSGDRIARGVAVPSLPRDQRWHFVPDPQRRATTAVAGGDVLGTVQETESIQHRILVPPLLHGELMELAPEGDYTIEEVIGRVKLRGDVNEGRIEKLHLFHRWPVRTPRPFRRRDHAVKPLLTGQRILDTFYPLLKGGKAAIPGPFGAGKTMLQQQIARWCNAEIVIYVGCGERGNELTDVLEFMPELKDPHTGRPLMERTLLVANTSNMPVVAREASIYVGVTLAEYFRDQGYDVVMVADSTSRWAEALREVAGRLGQMPVEEGYPAYLGSRLAAFYERAGRVETLSGDHGSVTLIGAVSPPGGDFSEPVTSHTKEIIQTFWGLSKELADARHYPAVDWLESFSGYVPSAAKWWAENVDAGWEAARGEALDLLAASEELQRIVNLVGVEALSSEQRWTLEAAGLIKEGLLQQSATDEIDSFSSPEKQFALLSALLEIYRQGMKLVKLGAPARRLIQMPLLAQARRWKSQHKSEEIAVLKEKIARIPAEFEQIAQDYEQAAPAARE